MKQEAAGDRDDRALCEVWQRENRRQGEDLNPRVVLFRADVERFGRWNGLNLPKIKEEPEEVSIKLEEEVSLKQEEYVSLKQEEEVSIKQQEEEKGEEAMTFNLYVKSEEEVPLLVLRDTPDRGGFIHLLTVHREKLQKQEDTEDTSKSPSLDGSGASEKQEPCSADPFGDRRLRHRFGKASGKTSDHKQRRGRTECTEVKTGESDVSGRKEALEDDVALPSLGSKEKSSGGTKKAAVSCPDCGASFTLKGNLHRHWKLLHSETLPFSCTVCNKKFASTYKLNYHMSTCNPGRFPHRCSVCKKGFRSKRALGSHILSHTEKHICSECGRSFKSKKNLKGHFRIHTGDYPVSCSVCKKGFLGAYYLQIHMRTHTGERPFPCTDCGQAFRQMKHYRVHMRVHTGEKPFSCEVCKRAFSRSDHVALHMKVHCRDKP